MEWNLSGYIGIRDVFLPGERDLWRDLEFRSELVVSLSFVYVGHLAFKFSPSKTAPIKPKMHTRDKHEVNSRYVNFIFSFFDSVREILPIFIISLGCL